MTKLEFIQWCEANNVPDDAVICLVIESGLTDIDPTIITQASISRCFSGVERNRLGITDTTPMVVEL